MNHAEVTIEHRIEGFSQRITRYGDFIIEGELTTIVHIQLGKTDSTDSNAANAAAAAA